MDEKEKNYKTDDSMNTYLIIWWAKVDMKHEKNTKKCP